MKYSSYLLLVLTLFVGLWGCNLANTTDSTNVGIEETPKTDDTAAVSSPAREEPPVITQAPRRSTQSPKPAAPARRPAAPASPEVEERSTAPAVATAPPAETVTRDVARVEPDPSPVTRDVAPRPPATPMVTVPAGAPLTVVMSDLVSTAFSEDGDTFTATLAEPWVVDGKVVAERGDMVKGRVQDVMKPGKVKGKAQLKLVLTQILSDDRTHKISTEPFVAIAVDNKERDAAVIAGGAGIGAAIGAITGGKKGAAIGAILGGGGGTTAVLITPGQDMKIEPETKVNFVLNDSVRLPIIRTTS
jgi:hypothetical protein